MGKDETRQHVPIFVGSTFMDLKSYREAVSTALHRLEAVVRGMEYFGSKPGSPVDECLAVVRSCNVYIGIFGMRYGSVPNGYDRSMTHLEYDEAQKHRLPSLIYMIDEQRQPILPIHVETGDGATKLRVLKDQLRQSHLVSFFTTEENLAGRLFADLPPVLAKTGTRLEGPIELAPSEDPMARAEPEVVRSVLLSFDEKIRLLIEPDAKHDSEVLSPPADAASAIYDPGKRLFLAILETVNGHLLRQPGQRDSLGSLFQLLLPLCQHDPAVAGSALRFLVDSDYLVAAKPASAGRFELSAKAMNWITRWR